jgi:pilus assembly protein Flp/PilA
VTPNRTTPQSPLAGATPSQKGSDMFDSIRKQIVRFNLVREDGQAMAEYALILALVALAVIVAITLLGTDISNEFNSIASKL